MALSLIPARYVLLRFAADAVKPGPPRTIPLRAGLSPETKMTVALDETNVALALVMYGELTGRALLPRPGGPAQQLDDLLGGRLTSLRLLKPASPTSRIVYHGDGLFSAAEVKERLEVIIQTNGWRVVPVGQKHLRVVRGGPGKPGVQGSGGHI